jgi:hypothetical protein
VLSQDDACALFGSWLFFTITNCTFSTRWSVFRFDGGTVKNIAVSNCILSEVYGAQSSSREVPGRRSKTYHAFDPRNPFTDINPATGAPTAPVEFHQNELGMTIGGPVVIPKIYHGTDRTFFFFGYEG